MRAESLARARAIATRRDALFEAAALAPPPCPIELGAFGVIAELKRRAPSVGALAPGVSEESLVARAAAYAEGGARAISVLTEPTRFDGALAHLEAVSGSLGARVPILRKDFLVDPVQVAEARCAGASGVLLVARMLDDAALDALVASALSLGLFVLLEAFDREDLSRAADRTDARVLLGLNCRDLTTLAIDPARFEALAPQLPRGRAVIAESGLESPEAVRRVAALGYRGALVGSALMRSSDPRALVRAMGAATSARTTDAEAPCA